MHAPDLLHDDPERLLALYAIALRLSAATGERFFAQLADTLTDELGLDYAGVMELDRTQRTRVSSVAFKERSGLLAGPVAYDLAGTPCQQALELGTLQRATGVRAAFPQATHHGALQVDGYVGTTLVDTHGEVIGLMMVMHASPIANAPGVAALLALLKDRVAAELQRWRADEALARQTDWMQLLEVIAVAANQARSVQEAIEFSLSRVCALTGWPIGHYWALGESGTLTSSGWWSMQAPARHDELCSRLAASAERSPLGRVLATGYPAFEAFGDSQDGGWAPAREAGLKACYAFPVVARGELTGVLEYLAEADAPPDGVLMDVMSQIGLQLGQVVERERAQHALRRSQARLVEAHHIAQLGTWEWDVATDEVTWNDVLYRLHGQDPAAFQPDIAWVRAHTHPDDRHVFSLGYMETRVGDGSPGTIRILHPDGEVRWLQGRFELLRNAEGRVTRVIGTSQDVTARMRAEQALKRTNAVLKAQQETSLDGILVTNEHQRILSYNQRFLELWNLPEALMAAGEEERLMAHVVGLLRDPEPFVARVNHLQVHPLETSRDQVHLRDGRVLDRYTTVIVSPEGQVFGRVWYFRDVTFEQQAEAKLEVRRRQLADAQRIARMGSWVNDLETGSASWSDELYRMFGVAKDAFEVSFESFLAFVHPDDRPLFTRQGLSPEAPFLEIDHRVLLGDGALRHIRTRAELVLEQGRGVRVIGTHQDITDQKLAELALRESEERYRRLVEQAPDAVLVHHDGRIHFANPAAARMFGADGPEAMRGLAVLDLVHPDFHAIHQERVSRSLRDVASGPIECTLLTLTGAGFEAEARTIPIHVGGEPSTLAVLRDITGRREVERMQREFLSIVSHELRTPLNTMMIALDLLQSGMIGEFTPKAAHVLEIALNNTSRLRRIVNDMLDIQLVEWGKLPLNLGACDMADLMGQARDAMQPQAAQLGVALEVAPLPVALVADADRIVQALTNLIANAVKYTSAGGRVWLTATADAHEVRLEVGDTGRGIPAEQLAAIFEKFQQVAPDEAREKGGAGLGLAITRAIVERHGGRVWTESEVGVGSRFFLALPRSGPEEPGGTP